MSGGLLEVVPAWVEVNPVSLDRPFGVYLWSVFTHFFELISGYPAEEFAFVRGQTVLASSEQAFSIIALYYVVIFGGRKLISVLGVPPVKLNALFQVHNALLTTVSFTLLTLSVEQLIPIVVKNGIFYGICDKGAWTQELITLYYLNYITKYIELLDTVFLVLKQKPLTFLHTYHHGATALLCFSQLMGHTSVSWVPITLNLAVHVVMYFYYFLSARGIRVWWKEWVTKFQIIQFVIDLGFVHFASYTYFANKFDVLYGLPWLKHWGTCYGEEYAAIWGCTILSSYLVLFISFYIRVYNKRSQKKVTKNQKVTENISTAKTTGVSDGSPVPTSRSRRV